MKKTNFGFEIIDEDEKTDKVANVFNSVFEKYDLMNDIMSVGLHRIWKKFVVLKANVRKNQKVLDIAGGTGDLSFNFAKIINTPDDGEIWLTDINELMLSKGRSRFLNAGLNAFFLKVNAENIPFSNNYFDLVVVSFGIRNMTNKEQALREMLRVIKPGAKVMILEFSKPINCVKSIYNLYLFNAIPWLGEKIVQDRNSYQYLAESIQMHPNKDSFKDMMLNVGFDSVEYYSLTAGIVALHIGYKY